MRIGLLYPHEDPTSPANWSGTPRGIRDGLAALGFEVVPIACRIPEPLRLPLALLSRVRGARGPVAHREPICAVTRSIVLSKSLARIDALDGLVAMGTDLYDLPRVLRSRSLPVATYDDGCFPLFLRYPGSDLHQHAFPVEAVHRWGRRQAAACQRADAACVSTAWAGRSIVDDFRVPRHRVHVVGMGHRPRVMPSPPRDWSTPRFLFVGTDWRRKNGARVLEAFARVRETLPHATLDIVGDHPRSSIPGVTGHGFLPRESAPAQASLDRLFAQATAFVLPSLFDPSPIAYLEAASAGLPVIATTCGGAGELLAEGSITIDPNDVDQIVRAMLRLSAGDVASAIGARARARAAGFTWPAVVARIVHAILPGGTPLPALAPA